MELIEPSEKVTLHLSVTVNGEFGAAFHEAVMDNGGTKADLIREALESYLRENGYLF